MSIQHHPALGILLFGLSLLLGTPAGADEQTLAPLPEPDLQKLEPMVRDQLQLSRDQLQALTGQPQPDPAQLATSYTQLAMLYHAYGLNDAAESGYLHALQIAPRQVSVNYYLGYLYEQTGRLEEAAKYYQYTLRLAPGQLPPLLRLAQVYTRLNQTEQAGLMLTLALQLHPNEPSLLAALGEQALAEHRNADAIQILEAVLKQVPAANRLHYPLAMAYRAQGDMEQAKQHLAQRGTVGIQPHDPLLAELEDLKQGERILLLRGKRAFAAGDYPSAIAAFQQAIAAKPDSARAHVNLGTALMQSGDKEQAIAAYREALKLGPDNATANFNLGVLLSQSGDLKGAAEHIEQTVAVTPKDTEALYYLAKIYRAMGDTDQAASYYRQTVVADPKHSAAWIDGIELLLKTGQFEKAQTVAEQAYKTLPSNGPVVHALARILASTPILTLRDGARALTMADKVYQARPSGFHAETLAMAHAQLGQCDDAVKWQQQAIDKAPAEGRADELPRLQQVLAYYSKQRPCAVPGQPAKQAETAPSEAPIKQP